MKKDKSRKHIAMLDNLIGMLDTPVDNKQTFDDNTQGIPNSNIQSKKPESNISNNHGKELKVTDDQEGSRRHKPESTFVVSQTTNSNKNEKEFKNDKSENDAIIRSDPKNKEQIIHDFEKKGTISYKQYNEMFEEKTDDIFNERMHIELSRDKILSQSEVLQLKKLANSMKSSQNTNKNSDLFGNLKNNNLAQSQVDPDQCAEINFGQDVDFSQVSLEIQKQTEQQELMQSATDEIKRLTESQDFQVIFFL